MDLLQFAVGVVDWLHGFHWIVLIHWIPVIHWFVTLRRKR